jgi:hypothetical protein
MNDAPPGGKLMTGPGSSLQPGSATAKRDAAATARSKAQDSKQVSAVANTAGQSSVRQIAGGVTEQSSGLATQSITAEFLAAEEAALDDAALPAGRREQIRRYFTALRKRLEK